MSLLETASGFTITKVCSIVVLDVRKRKTTRETRMACGSTYPPTR
jgi:hypothetical protein